MEFRVLGDLEVVREGRAVDLGAFRQRALLALFLTNPRSVVSTDHIIDGLWGDDGGDKQNALWVYVSGLRKALEPEREKRSEGTILLTRASGYYLDVESADIDAFRFERMVSEGRALADTDPGASSLVLGEALALWRGRAYEEFTYESFAQAEIARLEELRLEAVEARVEADLKRGMARELVSELESLVRQHPHSERLTGQLMLALYRSGRQAEALRCYQYLKSRLAEELGLEPSAELSRLEEQMVMGDAALSLPAPSSLPGRGPEPGLSVRGYELREKIGEGAFGVAYRAYQPAVGREVAIKVIRPELANDPSFIRRFEAEAQLVARLEHPHIVPLYDYWREPDAAYLVMRLMKGGNLADVLETSAIDSEQVTRIADQLGHALQTAHRADVVHRDIKPANILLDDEGNAYLSDFGIAVGAQHGSSGDASSGDASFASTLGPPYASPEQLAQGDVTPPSDIYSLGVVLAEALTGLSGDIVQTRGALPPPVLEVIDRATAGDAGERYDDVSAFVTGLREALGGTEVVQPTTSTEVENPYKGLRSFDAADASDFYGRERLIDRLVARLGEPGARGRFVAVVGPSGSGKSSVVKAGLLPVVRRGALPLSSSWFIVEMTPAPHPFEELEAALLGIAVDSPASLLEQLASGANGFQRAIRRVMPEDGPQLLLVIDQFEELFTQVDGATADRFLDTLVNAVTDEHSRVRVLVTLRADFYDRPLRHRGFGELLRDGTEVITPMAPEGLERAITGPVERHGVTFEPALVANLVTDVVDRAGALPLLQYSLTELFDGRRGDRITASAYEDLGGVSAALVQRAEGLMARLGEEAHDATRQVFLRLVSLGEGVDDTRRRILQSELEQLAVDGRILQAVLDAFGRHRLLSFDRDPVTRGPTVEISHEALLTEWTRLRDWIERNRSDVRFQRRLAAVAADWQRAEESPDHLLTGSRLAEAEAWQESTELVITNQERRYISQSAARAAEARLTRTRRRRVIATIIAATGALALAFLVFALTQRSAADRLEAVGEINRLIEAAEDSLASDPELSLLLAARAAEDTGSLGFDVFSENLEVLHQGLRNQRLLFTVDDARATAFSPDGTLVYVSFGDGSVSVRDATTGVEIDTIPASSLGSPGDAPLVISPDGRRLTNGYVIFDTGSGEAAALRSPDQHLPVITVDAAAGLVATAHFVRGADGRDEPGRVVAVWDAETGQELWSQDVVAPIYVDLSSDGTMLAVTNSPLSQDYSVIVIDVATGEPTEIPLPVETLGVAFHPTEDRLLLGIGDVIRHWDLESRTFIARRDGGHDATVSDLDISDDAALIASGDQVGKAIVRDADTGEVLFPLPAHGDVITRIDLSPDGDRLATLTPETPFGESGALRVFDTSREGGRDLATIQTGLSMLATVDLDPSGALLAVGDHAEGLRELWTISGEQRLRLPPHVPLAAPFGVEGPIAASPDGARLVTGDAAGEVRIWDVTTGTLIASTNIADMAPALGDTLGRVTGVGDVIFAVKYSSDGQRLAIGGAGFVLVADATTLGDVRVLHEGPLTFAERLSFSPDSTQLIASINLAGTKPEGFTNPIIVWDVSTGEEIAGHPVGIEGSSAVDYSPAGDLVAIGTTDITILDPTTWEITHTLRTTSRGVRDVAFSPDGDTIAAGYEDGGILIWDPHGGEPLYSLPGHDGPASDLDWSDDGARLVSVGPDGMIRVFAMEPAELLELARARVTRGLTDQECRQYLGGQDC